MKTLLVFIIMAGGALILFRKGPEISPAPSASASHPSSLISDDTISFIGQIQPILVNHCSPCHFTGGKMYDRLPFDKEETIINHEAGLLKRIKDAKEKALIQKFIGEHKK